MKISRKDLISAWELMNDEDVHSVTYFIGKLSDVKTRIRISRRMYRNGRFNRYVGEYLVTFGKPNFVERKFLRLCIKAGNKPDRFLLKYKCWAK